MHFFKRHLDMWVFELFGISIYHRISWCTGAVCLDISIPGWDVVYVSVEARDKRHTIYNEV